ncbi:GNAT family N-acetyltransferase [Ruegeria lacuscaerulensis]|uniref:GNAT family N-acetyltransferase n=2 Tax=Ruegeria lacuscaerulensis TaxID=55218 RepID=UPI0014800244|nr:GNAT family N-acetyltransferase [Ruegeria lacuscaerulensis]
MSDLILRQATSYDAPGIAGVLQALVLADKRSKPADAGFAETHYVSHPGQIQCLLALDGDEVLGFQSLKQAVEGNPYGAPVGWGLIGTHIRPSTARRGVGRALFQETLKAARAAGLVAIDATIGVNNAEGLAYYQAMGFVDYRRIDGARCKSFTL